MTELKKIAQVTLDDYEDLEKSALGGIGTLFKAIGKTPWRAPGASTLGGAAIGAGVGGVAGGVTEGTPGGVLSGAAGGAMLGAGAGYASKLAPRVMTKYEKLVAKGGKGGGGGGGKSKKLVTDTDKSVKKITQKPGEGTEVQFTGKAKKKPLKLDPEDSKVPGLGGNQAPAPARDPAPATVPGFQTNQVTAAEGMAGQGRTAVTSSGATAPVVPSRYVDPAGEKILYRGPLPDPQRHLTARPRRMQQGATVDRTDPHLLQQSTNLKLTGPPAPDPLGGARVVTQSKAAPQSMAAAAAPVQAFEKTLPKIENDIVMNMSINHPTWKVGGRKWNSRKAQMLKEVRAQGPSVDNPGRWNRADIDEMVKRSQDERMSKKLFLQKLAYDRNEDRLSSAWTKLAK